MRPICIQSLKLVYNCMRSKCTCSQTTYLLCYLSSCYVLITTQISTNGIISFDVPFFSADTARFPSSLNAVRNLFLVAPFWDDVDLRDDGDIFYEAHSTASGNLDSLNLMSQVDGYIQGETGEDFSGTWMLVAHWDGVHPWPHGETGDPGLVAFLKFRFPDHIFVR